MDDETTGAGDGVGQQTPEIDATRAKRRLSWPARVSIAGVVLLVVVFLAGFVIRVPYTTLSPGEALSLPPLVTVQGARSFPTPRGDIRLLFVRERNHVNLWQYVQARLDADIDLVKDAAINPGKLTPSQLNAEGLQQMAGAKDSATAVALRAAGYRVGSAPGLTVSELFPDLPAIKALRWGDVIVEADGHPIKRATDLTAVITKHHEGDQVTIVVLRAGKRDTVHVTVASSQGRSVIGVEVSPRFTFPFKVAVDTRDIGGPSAGLAMTLAILDDITSGDLTGGHRVAVTGTIDAEGNVGEIGGIEQKAVAARAAHVEMFIVPQCSPGDEPANLASCKTDLQRTTKRVGDKIKVVPVATFAQALAALRAAGGAPVEKIAPTSTTIAAA